MIVRKLCKAATVCAMVTWLVIASAALATAAPRQAGCHQTSYAAGGRGANHSGPYDDTCDGWASLNGSGGGNAIGKPCAGCVGKADEKNPKGQYANATDHNAGYECDRNHGIARTNPAHTGCRADVLGGPGARSSKDVLGGPGGRSSKGTSPRVSPLDMGPLYVRPPNGTPATTTVNAATTGVLGVMFTRPGVEGALARTGEALMEAVLLALAMIAIGGLARSRGPRASQRRCV